MQLSTEVGLDPGHVVLDGDPALPPLPKSDTATTPQFSAHVCCGKTTGWIKMPLGTEVGFGQGDIMLDGEPALLPRKGHSIPPLFGPCLLWPNGRPSQQLLSFCYFTLR